MENITVNTHGESAAMISDAQYKESRWLFDEASDNVARGNETFLQMLKDGMIREELEHLIEKFPSRWARFSGWLEKLPSRGEALSKAIQHIGYYIDDAQCNERFMLTKNTVLVGWQCGFEPMFVACHSYLDDAKLTSDDAVEMAIELLIELDWFGGSEPTEPDYVL